MEGKKTSSNIESRSMTKSGGHGVLVLGGLGFGLGVLIRLKGERENRGVRRAGGFCVLFCCLKQLFFPSNMITPCCFYNNVCLIIYLINSKQGSLDTPSSTLPHFSRL